MREMRKTIVAFAVIGIVLVSCLNNHDFDSAKQLTDDIATIDTYLAANNIKAYQDPSGIRYVITHLGTGGFPPRVYQNAKVNYSGRLLNGTVFDPGPSITAPLNTLIQGWQYIIPTWPVGTKGTIWIPSPLGYGTSSPTSTIPPNSILVFDVEVAAIVLTNAEKARFTSDTTTIVNYIKDNKIAAIKDTTGISYVIENPGTGPKPSWYDQVTFNFTGKNLANGNQFTTGDIGPNSSFASRVVDFQPGIQFALSKIGVGGRIIVYVPSGLGYGSTDDPATNLPADSNISYDVSLESLGGPTP